MHFSLLQFTKNECEERDGVGSQKTSVKKEIGGGGGGGGGGERSAGEGENRSPGG